MKMILMHDSYFLELFMIQIFWKDLGRKHINFIVMLVLENII